MKVNYLEEFGRVNLKHSNYKIGKLLKKFSEGNYEYERLKGQEHELITSINKQSAVILESKN